MVGGFDFDGYDALTGTTGGIFIVPLPFGFTQDIGLALPQVALQYHEIEIKLKLRKFDELYISSDGNAPSGTFKMKECRLCVEYIYLDADERKLFAKSNHEYLIKQTQYSLNNIVRSGTKTKNYTFKFLSSCC